MQARVKAGIISEADLLAMTAPPTAPEEAVAAPPA
jgi:hypothetical protein